MNLGTIAEPVTLTKENIVSFINTAASVLDAYNVPREGRWIKIRDVDACLIQYGRRSVQYITLTSFYRRSRKAQLRSRRNSRKAI